jgi:hypothetical protein
MPSAGPLFFAVLIGAPMAGCATTIAGLPLVPGDEPSDTVTQNETGAPSGGDTPKSGAPDDAGVAPGASPGAVAVDDSSSGQNVPTLDASVARFDATARGPDASDARSGANDAPSDNYVVVLDAMAVCASNVLTPTAAVASSVSPAGLVAGNAIDTIFTTRWESVHAVDPQWIYLDFGVPVHVNRVEIAWETACARNYDVQVSKDATAWTTLRAIVGNASGGPSPAAWTATANHAGLSGVGRYVRVNGTARCTQYGYSIWEMRVFGDTNSVCHP